MEERRGQDVWEVEAQNLVSQVGRDVLEPRGEEARGVDTGGSRQAALEKGLEASSQHPETPAAVPPALCPRPTPAALPPPSPS